MYILPIIIIISCHHLSIASNKTPIDLDIHIREDTNEVKVTKTEDGELVAYKIEPKNGYKIGKYTDGETIIYTPKKGEDYKYLDIKCCKSTDEVIITRLKYSPGILRSIASMNYFLYNDGWRIIIGGFYDYLISKIKIGEYIDRNIIDEEYNIYATEISKKQQEFDIESNNNNIPNGINKDTGKEDGISTIIYTVDSSTIISKVKYSKGDILERSYTMCGIYKIKIYYLYEIKLLILYIKYPKKELKLYYMKNDKKYLILINEEQFKLKLKNLVDEFENASDVDT